MSVPPVVTLVNNVRRSKRCMEVLFLEIAAVASSIWSASMLKCGIEMRDCFFSGWQPLNRTEDAEQSKGAKGTSYSVIFLESCIKQCKNIAYAVIIVIILKYISNRINTV